MKLRLGISLLLLLTFAAGKGKIEPDAINLSNGIAESPYFKFHYAFPQGWALRDDPVRMQHNRKQHEDAVKKARAQNPPNTPNRTTTTQVLWQYDLLLAAPAAVPASGYPPEPYVHVWAAERNSITKEPGDHAKLLMQIGMMKELHSPQKQTIGGQEFVRTDMVFKEVYISMFDTLSGDYLLCFEFRARNEQEMNTLANTMQSIKFD